MVRRYRNKKSQNGKKNGKALSKQEVEAVKHLIDSKLDAKVEDKYLRSHGGIPLNIIPNWAAARRSCLQGLEFALAPGSTQGTRTGQTVFAKGFHLQVRYQAANATMVVPSAGGPQGNDLAVAQQTPCPIQKMPDLRVYVYRVPVDLNVGMTVDEQLQALNGIYRAPGTWKQDFEVSQLTQSYKKGIKLLKKFKIPSVHKNMFIDSTDVNGRDTMTIYQQSEERHFGCFVPLNTTMKFADPAPYFDMNYRYYVFCTMQDAWGSDAAKQPATQPDVLNVRTCLIYEDA